MAEPEVLVTGIGSVSPFGTWRGLIGSPAPRPSTIARWPTRGPRRAYLVPPFKAGDVVPGLKSRRLDLLSVWTVAAAHLALEDAGVEIAAWDPARVAVVFGTGFGCLERTEAFLSSANRYGYQSADAIVFPETLANAPASHVARVFGFRGPNVTLSSRGISGESALLQARSLLRAAEADLAVVIAGDMLTRPLYEWYETASVLSRACFDEGLNAPIPFGGSRGFFPGEGVAALVLEPVAPGAGSRVGAYARLVGGLASVESGVSSGSWGRNPGPTLELVRRLGHGAHAVRFVVSSANGSVALDRLEAEVIRACFEHADGAVVSATKGVSGEFDAGGLLRLVLALSGQGASWDTTAFCGAALPGAPSNVAMPNHGFGVLLGSAAGGGRTVVSLELLARDTRA